MASRWMLYGATGYTGVLVAEAAVARGLKPVLAGRSAEKLAPLAERLGLEFIAVSLDDPAGLRRALEGMSFVYHAAGPFSHTSPPMVRACLDTKVSYLDITGEVEVFAHLFELDSQARERGICLIPGVGFDVVPTDCLAAYVAAQVPNALDLEIALAVVDHSLSPGTAKTMLEMVQKAGLVRDSGRLRTRPFGQGVKRIRFSQKERWVMPAPLGDLVTAFHSTRVPNVTTYVAIPSRVAKPLRRGWPALAVAMPLARKAMAFKPLAQRLAKLVEQRVQGPDAQARTHGRAFAWARAQSPSGQSVEAWLETTEGYDYTAAVGVRVVERMLKKRPVGTLSPAQAFGADFALEVPGTKRLDRL
jgi:short subunit dehydrogenase-like uncharacterized protein